MTDLSAVLQLRERICQRLRVSPGDAEAEQHLLAWYGFHGDVERYVAERVCSLAAMLAMDTGAAGRLQSQPQRGTLMAWALEAVAHTFAAEVAQLRVLLREVSRHPPWRGRVRLAGRPGARVYHREAGPCSCRWSPRRYLAARGRAQLTPGGRPFAGRGAI
jgi:hypothetical protein